MATYGYAGKILWVDLTSRKIQEVPTSDYAASFLGGRGIAAKIYWDGVPPQVKPFDPENRLVFATGPLGTLSAIGASRWQVSGKSATPVPEQFCNCDLGGKWGAELKFAGYDALMVQGQAEKPVYILVRDGVAEFRDASSLWGKGALETRETLKSELGSGAKVVTIGPAGENMVVFANLVADDDATGSSGFGAVMGSKKLKAIVVQGTKKSFGVAHPERFQQLVQQFRSLRQGIPMGDSVLFKGPNTKKAPCYGCIGNCARRTYTDKQGKTGKFMCQSGLFYTIRAERYYGTPDLDVPFHATRLCDDMGVDTMVIDILLLWLSRCHKAGVFTEEATGLPILSQMGSWELIESLVKKIAYRQGFGDLLAHGIERASEMAGPEAKAQVTDYLSKAGQFERYGPRLYIANGLIYAIEPKQSMAQLHEICMLIDRWEDWVEKKEGAYVTTDLVRRIAKTFWGSEIAGDFTTYEGKALAARKIQDRQYVKECLILCDWLWPITDVEFADDHLGDPTFESKVVSAALGLEVDEESLNRYGERVFNLQRAILTRERGKGREGDTLPEAWFTKPLKVQTFVNPECIVPGKDGEIASRKGAVVEREKFEALKTEFYQLRGWDPATGLQTRAKLQELGLAELIPDLEKRGLVR